MARLSTLIVVAVMLAVGSPVSAAQQAQLAVSASVTGKGKCTPATPPPLNFGNLDAFNPVDVQKSVVLDISCVGIGNSGTTFIVQYLNPAAPHTMKHTSPPSPETVPYTLDLPQSFFAVKNKASYTITLTGSVKGVDYKMAPIGGYTDNVTLQVVP
jgi:spore coat protein U-like protein